MPGSQFTADGPRQASDAARIDLGANLAFDARTSLFGKLTTEFSGSSYTVAGNGGLKVAW